VASFSTLGRIYSAHSDPSRGTRILSSLSMGISSSYVKY
jgi:hypothetical protein